MSESAIVVAAEVVAALGGVCSPRPAVFSDELNDPLEAHVAEGVAAISDCSPLRKRKRSFTRRRKRGESAK